MVRPFSHEQTLHPSLHVVPGAWLLQVKAGPASKSPGAEPQAIRVEDMSPLSTHQQELHPSLHRHPVPIAWLMPLSMQLPASGAPPSAASPASGGTLPPHRAVVAA